MRRPSPSLLALALVVAWPAIAAADGEDEAASTELFNAGRDLMRRGDYAAACPKLADSARLKPTVGALAKLAECEEHERRLVSAYTRWKQALNLARSLGDERLPDVEAQVVRLDRLVAKVRVVAATALPPSAVIRIDDTTFSIAGLGVPLPVEIGPHVVSVSAPNARSWSTTVDVREEGATASVTLPPLEAVEPVAAEQPPAQAVAPSLKAGSQDVRAALAPGLSPDEARRSATWRTVGLAVAGTGLGALAAGGVLGAVAIRQRDQAHCVGTVCPDEPSASTLRSAKTWAEGSTALLIAGGVLLASGAAVWLVVRSDQGGPRLGAAPLPGGAMIAAGWQAP
jgi:hypothetical protein